MRLGRIVAAITLIVFCLLNVGCIGLKQYRTDISSKETISLEDDAWISVRDDKGNGVYDIGFVELDDQGWLFEKGQLARVSAEISGSACEQPPLIVAFMHGWHHNAKSGDDNIVALKDSLETISGYSAEKRRVIGVYVGWRGQSWIQPIHTLFTFWGRKETSERLGHSGVSYVYAELEAAKKAYSQRCSDAAPRMIVIGHSFGGAATFAAYNSQLMERTIKFRTMKSEAILAEKRGMADLVVLANPAFEAARAQPLMTADAECYSRCRPMLVVLTSKTDTATKWAFPAGRWLSTIAEGWGYQDTTPAQGGANRTAIGHDEEFLTHDLKLISATKKQLYEDCMRKGQRPDGTQATAMAVSDGFCGYAIKSLPNRVRNARVMNIRVDGEIIDGHGLLPNQPALTKLLWDLINVEFSKYPRQPPLSG